MRGSLKTNLRAAATAAILFSLVMLTFFVENMSENKKTVDAYAQISSEAQVSEAVAQTVISSMEIPSAESMPETSKDVPAVSSAQSSSQESKQEPSKAPEKPVSSAPPETKSTEPSKSESPKADGKKTVYLTFDDGPSPVTPRVLEVLKKYEVKATFFVIGTSYTQHLKQITEEGHAIGLHSYTHNYERCYKDEAAFIEETKKISDLVKQHTGIESKLIRFPGGTSNKVSKKINKGIMTRLSKTMTELGYVYFDWNCSNGDAERKNVPASELLSNIKKQTGEKQEITVLMHDGYGKWTTAEALPSIIEHFKEKGYAFDILTTETKPYQAKPAN